MSWSKKLVPSTAQPVAEINMIPLIDVMLVLLVIFMITAPLLTHSIKVNLPQVKTTTLTVVETQKPLEITITADGKIYLGQQEVTREALQIQLAVQALEDKERTIHIRADEQITYSVIAKTLADVNRAGLTKIGLMLR